MDFPTLSDTGRELPIRAGAIAFDLDGTLLDYDGHLSDSVARAIQLIYRAGIRVFIISGRMQAGCERYWRQLELDTPIASCNGAHVGFPGEKPFFHERLSQKARDIILAYDVKHNQYFNYCVDNRVFSLHDGADRDYYSRLFTFVTLANSPDEIAAMNMPTKCLCITPESEQARIMAELTDLLAGVAVVTRSSDRFIEILPPGANKGVGLEKLAEWSQIPIDQFIAVGDAMNDKPMLEIAGFAISFKSGDPKLAELVDMLLPPLWEDGMEILAKCVLGMTNSGRFFTPRSSRFFKK